MSLEFFSMRVFRPDVIIIFILLLVIGSHTLSHAGTAQAHTAIGDSQRFIQSLATKALATLSDKTGTIASRERKLRAILQKEFAMKKIARFVIGIHWRQMNRFQRRKYEHLFSEWVLKTYAARLGGYSGETFQVTRASDAGKGDIIVHSRILQTNGSPSIKCNWRVRNFKGQLKIIDVYVEGISMAVTQRSEFAAIIKKNGLKGLLARIENRLQ